MADIIGRLSWHPCADCKDVPGTADQVKKGKFHLVCSRRLQLLRAASEVHGMVLHSNPFEFSFGMSGHGKFREARSNDSRLLTALCGRLEAARVVLSSECSGL